eukprot:PhM_4_TR2430/c6_g3_i3/m.78571
MRQDALGVRCVGERGKGHVEVGGRRASRTALNSRCSALRGTSSATSDTASRAQGGEGRVPEGGYSGELQAHHVVGAHHVAYQRGCAKERGYVRAVRRRYEAAEPRPPRRAGRKVWLTCSCVRAPTSEP